MSFSKFSRNDSKLTSDAFLSPQLNLKLLQKFENEQFIVINDNGEINYDEKTLQSIIGEILFFTFLTGVQLAFQ